MRHKALFREGIPALIAVVFLTVLLYIILPWLAILGLGLIYFVIYFFRDPERKVPNDETCIIAPADGIITDISNVKEETYLNQMAICISIFMSPIDVHINRSPITGTVDFIKHTKGKFRSATKRENLVENEKNYIGIKNDKITVLVVQIAGMIARRIVNWSRLDQSLQKGDKIGMIKFSSGTQIFLPVDTEITVKIGDKVVSGETIIGRY